MRLRALPLLTILAATVAFRVPTSPGGLACDVSQPSPVALSVEVERGPVFPYEVQNAAVTTDGLWIYVVAGQPQDVGFYTDVVRIDPSTGAVEDLPSYPFPVGGARSVVLDGVLYVVGGNVDTADEDGYAAASRSMDAVAAQWDRDAGFSDIVGEVQRLDLAKGDAWEIAGYLSIPRTDHTVVAMDGRILAMGGNYYPTAGPFDRDDVCNALQERRPRQAPTFYVSNCTPARVETFDPQAGVSELGAKENLPRNMAGSALVDNAVVTAGGVTYGASGNATPNAGDLAEVYEGGALRFTPTRPPAALSNTEGATLNGTAWFLTEAYGSPDGVQTPMQLFGYDPARDSWVSAPLGFTRAGAGLVAVGDRLWVVGGHTPDAADKGVGLPILGLRPSLRPALGGGCAGTTVPLE